eukprot:UN19243
MPQINCTNLNEIKNCKYLIKSVITIFENLEDQTHSSVNIVDIWLLLQQVLLHELSTPENKNTISESFLQEICDLMIKMLKT